MTPPAPESRDARGRRSKPWKDKDDCETRASDADAIGDGEPGATPVRPDLRRDLETPDRANRPARRERAAKPRRQIPPPRRSGGHSARETPDPFPNSAVKPRSADGTAPQGVGE